MSTYKLKSPYTGPKVDELLDKIDALAPATESAAGTMSAEDKTKLNAIEAGAEKNKLEAVSVAGTNVPINNKTAQISVDATPTTGSTNPVQSGGVADALAGKQATISDLDNIRAGAAAGGTAYQKPQAGIPMADLAADVTTVLTDATPTKHGLMSAADKTKLDGIEENAQENVIEQVQVNGVARPVSSKAVNIPVPTKTSDLVNDDSVVKDAQYVHTDNNFTDAEQAKLAGIESGAQVNVKSDWQAEGGDAEILNKPDLSVYARQAAVDEILLLVPGQASSTNQLADKEFVNSSVASSTATFRGTSPAGLSEQQFLDWAHSLSADSNDYVFWQTVDTYGNIVFKRYKYDGDHWLFEYDLNNSSFTAAQWAAINSGITDLDTAKLSDLPTASELSTEFDTKQDVISDLSTIRAKANSAYQKPTAGIQKTDLAAAVQTSLSKADTAIQSHQDISGKEDKSNKVTAFNNPTDTQYPAAKLVKDNLDNKANVDGYYGGMTVGSAENLVGRGSVEAEYGGIRTSAGSADIGSGSASIVRMKGNSFKWNQLVRNGNFVDGKTGWSVGYYAGKNALSVGNNVATITKTESTNIIEISRGDFELITGHKYVISYDARVNQTCNFIFGVPSNTTPSGTTDVWAKHTAFYTVEPGRMRLYFGALTAINADTVLELRNIIAIDLTAIFGSGNEPATVEEFDAWREEMGLTLDYYEYNEGEVINNRAQAIETIGFNLYDASIGKAYLPGKYSDYPQEYEICGTFSSISFKDVNGNESVPTLTDGRFFNVDAPGELTVVGGNATDTLVHLVWSGWRNQGEPDYAYEAYWKNRLNIGLTTLKGKLNGAGESVVIFPNGLAKIGDVQDEIVGNKAIKRIGSRAYASGDESDATVMTDGHALTYYVLTTPEEYILDETPEWNYRVDDFGTEQAIPSYSASELTAPISYDVQYAMNAVDAIRRLDKNYVRRDNVKQVAGRSETDVLSQKAVDDNYAKKVGVENDLVAGAAKTLAGNQRQVKEFTTMVMDGADGIAKINEVRGRSIVWNQLAASYSVSKTIYGVTFTRDANTHRIILNGTATGNGQFYIVSYSSLGGGAVGSNHKGLIGIRYVSGDISGTYSFAATYVATGNPSFIAGESKKVIYTVNGNNPSYLYISFSEGAVFSDYTFEYQLFDLTLMFGAGNEPSTVEEFEAMFPAEYYEYNAGEIISNKTEKLGVTGFNQWDEEWESGYYSNTGQFVSNNTQICTKNYIPVFPGQTYYCNKGNNNNGICYYNANKGFIERVVPFKSSFTVPSGVYFVKLNFGVGYGPTYNHDICINISDPAKNGTYEPYKHADLPLNLSTITGKLNGEGESVTIFPNGMRSAGTAHDYLIVDEDGYARKAVKVMESVDMGTLNWTISGTVFVSPGINSIAKFPVDLDSAISALCLKYGFAVSYRKASNVDKVIYSTWVGAATGLQLRVNDYDYETAAAFKTAMSGVELIYELAIPLTYDLDEPIPMTFMAHHEGTITQTPQAPESAPMVANMTFAIDAVSTLNGLPENYVSKESLQAMLAAMQSAGVFASYTMTYNSTTHKYDFTFTKSS